MISQSPEKVVLRNFEGVITTYPEPEELCSGRADDYLEIYTLITKRKSRTWELQLL